MTQREIKLGVFLMGAGHHIAAWRHPSSPADAYEDIDFYINVAQTAERGKLDLVFISDALSLTPLSHPSELVRFEPTTLIAALSIVTKQIGLAATVSTTYNEPYHVARKFASIDQLNKGRTAWNIVTSYYEEEAKNFGYDSHPNHGDRYKKADEFVKVVKQLWHSWEDGALIRDKERGIYFDQSKLKTINHQGHYFKVKGPLNASRSKQGQPVLIQAGSSSDGMDFASKHAEIVFTAQPSIEKAQQFYAQIKAKAQLHGRQSDDLYIMPGVAPIVGKTKAEALDKFQRIQELISPEVGLAFLSEYLGGIDLSKYPLDGYLPEDIPETNGNKSRRELIIELARKEKLTIKQLYQKVAGARGHWMIFGTAEEIADQLEEWFNAYAADGFNLMFPYYPQLLEQFVDEVIPILQQRGLYKRDYQGDTLREHFKIQIKGNNSNKKISFV